MTTFDETVALAEQLSPAEQARLVVLLAERLQRRLTAEEHPTSDVNEPVFWHLAGLDDTPDEATTPQAEAAEATGIMLRRWFAQPLSEADALDLAMSESLGEWNLER